MSFSLNLKKLADKAGNNADAVVKKIALDVLSTIVNKSPVDTGRFRGNWQLGVGSVDSTITSAESKDGAESKARAASELNGFKSGKTIFISNSLPYAQRLENGYSDQSPPNAMVKLTLIEFRRKLRKAAR
jgi:Bacteriophage HK97-gp10, putative tail-component